MDLMDVSSGEDLLEICSFLAKYLNIVGMNLKLNYSIVKDKDKILGVAGYRIVNQKDLIVEIWKANTNKAEQLLLNGISVRYSYEYNIKFKDSKQAMIGLSYSYFNYLRFTEGNECLIRYKKRKQNRVYNSRLREFIEFKMLQLMYLDIGMNPSKYAKYSKIRQEITGYIGKSRGISQEDYEKAIDIVDSVINKLYVNGGDTIVERQS